jgi:hypothetical protein
LARSFILAGICLAVTGVTAYRLLRAL